MHDPWSSTIARYSLQITPEMIEQTTASEVKRRILDIIGVGVAAKDQPAPRAARRYAYRHKTDGRSLLWGTNVRTTPEVASLVNGVAVRYFDYNDTYLSLEPMHPSDMIPAVIAVAEERGASGRDVIAAVAVAYEVAMTLCDTFSIRAHGWDHVNVTAIGACCGVGRLMGLSRTQLEHALAITVVPHVAMRQTRAGELAMWKGFAAADAVRHAVYAAELAESGVEGPYQPFHGEMGFIRQLLGGHVPNPGALDRLNEVAPPRRIRATHIKAWPVEYHAQSAVDAALSLRQELGDPANIASVKIYTFKAAYDIIAKDPEKWHPKTRETADHSLPYIVAAALLDGRIGVETFHRERYEDPEILEFLRTRVALEESPELTAGYPEGIPNRIEVELKDGRRLVRQVTYPPGHARNPLSDERLDAKVGGLLTPVLGEETTARVIDTVRRLDEVDDIRTLTDLLVV